MKGKTVVITGPTSGLGREIALGLAKQGASLVLACRDVAKGEGVAGEVERVGAPRPQVLRFEASSQRSVRELAAAVRAKVSRVDVLVNNAGVHCMKRELSADGIELTFATNALAYFTLSNELRDVLVEHAPSRIVNVASSYAGGLDLDDLQFERRPYARVPAYKQSKQANRMLSWALARRLKGTGVTVNAMNPGLVWSNLYRDLPGGERVFLRVMSSIFGSPPGKAADCATWLASSPDLATVTGRFWAKRRETRCAFRDEAREEKLWAACEALVATTA